MQAAGVILVLINILTIAAPFAVVAITYQDNFSEVVVPPPVAQVMGETFPSGLEFSLPTFVDAAVDESSRTVTLTVNFTNPLNYNLTLKEVSADVVCRAHNVSLGHADVEGQMFVPAAKSVQVDIVYVWTYAAEAHFLAEHSGEMSVQVNLIDITVNVNDITLEIPEAIECPVDIPLTGYW